MKSQTKKKIAHVLFKIVDILDACIDPIFDLALRLDRRTSEDQ